ncbi:hypothetical protein T01_16317 [Trichinella spiralis]|uniref:Uncharacterized protein n=1 Tax=Trichinella spiralis TaxID=6334 RepID=A0A0V1ATK4_TRISP|nr:hypothetical protein T01_16317 [Trichinella spiralis]
MNKIVTHKSIGPHVADKPLVSVSTDNTHPFGIRVRNPECQPTVEYEQADVTTANSDEIIFLFIINP